MGRSLKKGPFVEERLMKRIDDMNAANEKKVVDVSDNPTVVINDKFMIPVDRISDILDAEVAKNGENYIIKYNEKEFTLTSDKCIQVDGCTGLMTSIEDILKGLDRGYVTDPTTDLLIVGNVVTMNNIMILSNLSNLMDRIDNIDDTRLVNKMDKIDKQVKKLSTTIEKLATYVDE